jgi:hypothetical protein
MRKRHGRKKYERKRYGRKKYGSKTPHRCRVKFVADLYF